jgi:hypothetical protein
MNYTWTYAQLTDANELLDLSLKVQYEVNTIFKFNPNVLAHNLVMGLVNQYYTGSTDLLAISRNENNRIIAYTWAKSGDKTIYSEESMVSIRMAHVDPDLSLRHRILLLEDELTIWERFAQITKCPIILSSTLRQNQNVFMRLHERAGYIIRGSVAYKQVDINSIPNHLFS